MAFLSIQNVNVSYTNKQNVLDDLNINIEEGELIGLLGPSGCGKTTFLRAIAGFKSIDNGDILLSNKSIVETKVSQRDISIVFQNYALFPHLNVFDNIMFGLKVKKMKKQTKITDVNKMVEICDLTGLEKRMPNQLSGGQKQRVALARALVGKPSVLLLDEPLSQLDESLRMQMRQEIKQIQKKLNITTIFVTHDLEECFSIADKVAVMNQEQIEQMSKPESLYKYPKTRFVASFVGFDNFIVLEKIKDNQYMAKDKKTIFEIFIDNNKNYNTIAIRSNDLRFVEDESISKNIVMGKIRQRIFLGECYLYEVETLLGTLKVSMMVEKKYQIGERVNILIPSRNLIFVK